MRWKEGRIGTAKAEGKFLLGWTRACAAFFMAFQGYRRRWHKFCSAISLNDVLFRSGSGRVKGIWYEA
jgi:hypothetical protein